MKPVRISVEVPPRLIEAVDRVAKDEMLSRADVIRRAIRFEVMAADGTHGPSISPDAVLA